MHTRLSKYPTLDALCDYWRRKRDHRSMPRPSDIHPFDIPTLLPHVSIVERVSGSQFRYRLMGTAVVEAYGFDGTGKTFEQVLSGQRLLTANRHCGVAWERRKPLVTSTSYLTANDLAYRARRVLLPLSDDGERVTKLLIGNSFAVDLEGAAALFEAPERQLREDRFEVLEPDQHELRDQQWFSDAA